MKNYLKLLLFLFVSIGIYSCASDDDYVSNPEPTPIPVPTSPVNFNIDEVPYQTLSEYNFYEGEMKYLTPVYGVIPYELSSPLFSDYAHKQRFLWMPNDVSASYVSDSDIFDFPIGTILIKNFYYDKVLPNYNTKIIETRLMIKKAEGWVFAEYIWNENQTEADLDLNGRDVYIQWDENSVTNSVNFRVPSEAECHTCHKTGDVSIPIGPKPRNINMLFNYGDGTKNQLQKWTEIGYLEDTYPDNIESLISWEDTSQSLNLRARSYLDINCAHCHSEEAHCAYRPVRFDFESTSNPINLGICVEPDTEIVGAGLTHIVNPGSHDRSVLYYRLNSIEESERMPLLGRSLKHEEGVQLIREWINSLTTQCN
ncbi:SO2930 family diheme c-type cytochrome [Formosa maritima]|uniref:SO2930 family diheme c-type cytochrome n=1 Tax=Formosa maritima TaxID=2592046 RepID=UPI001F22476E|nr:SO2930 family diheme c-type cytochrome [Formosa maritima]